MKQAATHITTAPVTYLADWKKGHRRVSGTGKIPFPAIEFGITSALGLVVVDVAGILWNIRWQYETGSRQVRRSFLQTLGLHDKGDALVTATTDIASVRPGELVAVQPRPLDGYLVGFLQCARVTQWRVVVGEYESFLFHPNLIGRIARVLDGLRDGHRLNLLCHQMEARTESARILTWHSAGAVAAEGQDATGERKLRGKEAQQ